MGLWKIPLPPGNDLDFQGKDEIQGLHLQQILTHTISTVYHTVDGRNSAPVDVVDIPVSIGFYTSQVVSRVSEPSTVFTNLCM